jgi:hypothetical protein
VVVEELDGFICLVTEWMQQLPPQPVRLMMQVADIPEPECLPCEQAVSFLRVSALIVSL